MKLKLMLTGALLLASAQAMACYTVFDGANRVMYQGTEPPVDMSQPLRDALQRRYPGGHMVFEQGADCVPVPFARLSRPAGAPAPRNTVVIAAAAPNTAVMGGPPNTAVMGAGPARSRTATPPAAPLRSGGTSPLLTDLRTAQAMRLPYQSLSGDIVVVPAAAASRVSLPSMTVIPADRSAEIAAASSVPDTRAMGAGPVRAPVRANTVITELHNPPVTVIQEGRTVTLRN
jgi:hypothetical protein